MCVFIFTDSLSLCFLLLGNLESMCLYVFILVCLKLITYLKTINFRSLQGSTRFSQLVEELLKITDAFELDTGIQCKCCMLEGWLGNLGSFPSYFM